MSRGARPLADIRGEVVFDDVWAEYVPGEPVLKGINLAAKARRDNCHRGADGRRQDDVGEPAAALL